MRLFVHHRTDYRFSEPQSRIVQLLRLTPASHAGQNVVDWRIDVDCNARLRSGRDGFGNETNMLYVEGPLERMSLTVTGEVLTEDRAGMIGETAEPLPPLLFLQTTKLTAPDDALRALGEAVTAPGGSALDHAHRLNTAVYDRLEFETLPHYTPRSAADVLAEGHGTCQDLAHVFISCARSIGMPARYVSGHLFLGDQAEAPHDAAHGWAEAYVEGYGWIGFDPANDRCPDDAYVRIAIGLDYRDAAPLSGTRTGGGNEVLEVDVRVALSQSQTRA